MLTSFPTGIAARRCLLCGGVWLAIASCLASANELPKQLDSLVAAAAKGEPIAPVADDATFVRRVYLDLAGRIPSYQETTGFLADQAADKRTVLIDKLLASKEFPRRMQDWLNAMLMERRGDSPDWSKFLQVSCEANKPWDQLAKEILDPDPENEALRGAAFFHTKRLDKVGQQETDYPGLTRDVGRLFLGLDLQCAQCHNHLFIESYKQVDFQGLFTVYQNTYIRTDVKFPAIGEKLMTKKQEFMSVFDKVPLTTGPRVPFGKEIEIPVYEKNEEYVVPPNRQKNFSGQPKFRPMQSVAAELTNPANQSFADNLANRLWFVMMGRGLVMPLDQHHVGNPPSHPEALALLGKEVVARKFDVKTLLRLLALSETYQRASVWTAAGDLPAPQTFRVSNEKRLSAEQVVNSVLVATGPRDFTPPAEQKPDDKVRLAFVKAFGNVPMDPEIDFAPSLKSSLFVLNDAAMLDCLTPREGNLMDRLLKAADAAAMANEMYVCILNRSPSEEEQGAVAEYLNKNADRRQAAVTNLAWSLLASTEFCLNH